MQIFRHTILIARPREVVFDFFVNWDAAPQWRAFVRSMRPATDAPVRAGSTINVVMDIAGEEYKFDMKVITCDRPSLWRHQTDETDFNGFIEYRFDEESDGTRVTMTGVAKPRSLYGWLGLPLMWLGRKRSYREQLGKLERALEAAQ